MRFTEAVSVYPALQTSRFVLRRPTDQDIPSIVEIAGHWEIASRLARVPYPYDADAARFFVDVVVPAELAWAIIERETNAMVGIAGLAPDEDEAGTISLGYYVARDKWGRGIATEAGRIVVAYAIGLVGRERLTARCFADNPASARVLTKLGFVRVGVDLKRCLALGVEKASVRMRQAAR